MPSTTSIDRRRFLQVGGLGVGLGVARPSPGLAQTASREGESTRVRMVGDGLSMTVAESASVWTELGHDIVRDSYSNGGVVERLEQAFAKELGKERAVFLPTGTLANHLAVRNLASPAGRPTRAIVQAESHLFNDSGDCVQTLSGVTLVPLGAGRAGFTLEEVQEAIRRTASGRVAAPISVISLETPVRRKFGETFDAAEMARIVTFAQREGIRLHLDGARIYLQSAYTGRSVAEYAKPFDTVYVSLYKYFNAPSGAILAGPRDWLDGLYHERRMFGAGLPSAWPFASIAAYYQPGFLERFRRAVETSESLIARLTKEPPFRVSRIPAGTNIFDVQVAASSVSRFQQYVRDHGVDLGMPRPGGRFRLSVNETWNRRSAQELEDIFVGALSA